MDKNFEYSYSAESHREIEEIRKKYMVEDKDSYESKLGQLRALDRSVTKKGTIAAIAVGTISALILGLGMSFIMVWGNQLFIHGMVLGLFGIIGVCAAYPLYHSITKKEQQRIAPMILKLSDELDKMSP